MFQSRLPRWTARWTDYASDKVADNVASHEAWGLAIYCYFRDAVVKLDSAIEAPAAPGRQAARFDHRLACGEPGCEIAPIVNQTCGRVYAQKPAEAMRQTLNEFGGFKN